MKLSELKKLAKVCREAGIKHYKSDAFEFTLTDDAPVIRESRSANKISQAELDKPIESDDITEDAMLFWSVGEDFSQESKAS